MEQNAVKLEKKDLKKSWMLWVTFGQACYNYERMQGLGFCHSMKPIIERLYGDNKEARADAMKRHLTYYNTENNWGASIAGICASLEEDKRNGSDIPDETINGVKTALMGPLAGIGDTITQSLVKTILLGIGIGLAMSGNILGPLIFLIGLSAYTLFVSYQSYFFGYKSGKSSITRILGSGIIKEVTEALGALGMMVLGSLVATNIGVRTPFTVTVSGMTMELQGVLDSIFPRLLPLALFIGVYLLVNKGMKPVKIIGILFIVAIIGSLLGVLA